MGKNNRNENFIQELLSRRSVRSFTGEGIPEEDLRTLVRAGMAAPSAVNVQPWAFVVVTEKDRLARLRDRLPYAKMLDKAGAAIVVCGLPNQDGQFAERYWPLDCSAAAENILLAAHALRYGAVWTAVYPERERIDAVKDECAIPESAIPLCVVPIGVPADGDRPALDKFDESKIHRETW